MDFRFEQLRENLESAVEGMSSEQLSWHLPGKWCAAEVLEHLYLSYTGTISGFERVLRKGKPLASRASMGQRVLTFVIVRLGHMPSGRKAPAVAQPRGSPAEQVRSEIGEKLAAQWRKLHVVHGRHHMKQILRLRESTKDKWAECSGPVSQSTETSSKLL